MVVQPFGFQEYLMSVPIPEADHLILYGGAIARPPALNGSAEQGRTPQPFPNDAMGPVIGAGDGATELRQWATGRSDEPTSELQSLMRIPSAVFCLKKKKKQKGYLHLSTAD